MTEMSVEFVGGELNGQTRSPINEEELLSLGYKPQIKSQPHGNELAYCLAVPNQWSPEEAHRAVLEAKRPRRNR